MTLTKLALDQLQKLYRDYSEDYDPSPQYAYDGYCSPLQFEDWLEDEDEGFLRLCVIEGYDPASVESYWNA